MATGQRAAEGASTSANGRSHERRTTSHCGNGRTGPGTNERTRRGSVTATVAACGQREHDAAQRECLKETRTHHGHPLKSV
jgi:hypothetical protein